MYCKKCGVKLPAGAEMCLDCGAKVQNTPFAGEVENNEAAGAAAESAEQQPNFNGANPNCPPPNFNGGANPNYQQPNFNGANPNYPPPNFNGGVNPNYPPPYPPYPPYPPQANPNDTKSTGLNVLAFFIPVVGLILWLATRDDKPIRAKSIGKSALIGFITGIVAVVVMYVAAFAIIFSSADLYDDDYDLGDNWTYNYDFDDDFAQDYFDDFTLE